MKNKFLIFCIAGFFLIACKDHVRSAESAGRHIYSYHKYLLFL